MKQLGQYFQLKTVIHVKKSKLFVPFLQTLLLLTLILLFISYDALWKLILSKETGFVFYVYLVLVVLLLLGIIYYLIKKMAYSQLVTERQESQAGISNYGIHGDNRTKNPVLVFHSVNEPKHVDEELALSEAQLKEALERYDFISQATSDTIWDWDIPNDTILYNAGIHKMFGYTSQQVQEVHTWWMSNIHPQDVYHVTQMLEVAFMRRNQHVELLYRYRCADGSYKYIFDRAFIVYNSEGKPVRMIGSMQDETRRYEEENRITRAIILAQETERQQLGMELHDNVNQILSAANLHLGIITSKNNINATALQTVHTVKMYISEAIDEIRRLSHQLAPASDVDVSLGDLIRTLLQSVNVDGKYELHFKSGVNDANKVAKDIKIGLYRVLQEQLNNIVKHAKATLIDIELKQEDNVLQLSIKDNGIGFDTAVTSCGIGLENIRRRVKFLHGTIHINSAPQKGCELVAIIPVRDHRK